MAEAEVPGEIETEVPAVEEEPQRPIPADQMFDAYEQYIRDAITPWNDVNDVIKRLKASDADFEQRYERTDKETFHAKIEEAFNEEVETASQEEVDQHIREIAENRTKEEPTKEKAETAVVQEESATETNLLPPPPADPEFQTQMIYRASVTNSGSLNAKSIEQLEEYILDNFFFDDRILDPEYIHKRKVFLRPATTYRNGKPITHKIKGVAIDQDVLQETVSAEEYRNRVYIGIYNEQGELLGFLDSPYAISERDKRDYDAIRRNKNIRELVVSKGEVEAEVQFSKAGPFARVPLNSVATNAPDSAILLNDGEGWVGEYGKKDEIPVSAITQKKSFSNTPVPLSELKGHTFLIVDTIDGPIPTPTQSRQLGSIPGLADMLAKAVESYFLSDNPASQEFRQAIKDKTGLDIFSLEGLNGLFNKYVYAADHPIRSDLLKKKPNYVGVSIWNKDGSAYVEYGTGGIDSKSINEDHTKLEQIPNILLGFKEMIQNMYLKTSKNELLYPNREFPVLVLDENGSLRDMNKGKTYMEYLKESVLLTDIATPKLSNGKRASTINNVLLVVNPDKTAPTPIQTEEEATPQQAEEQTVEDTATEIV